MARNWRTFWTGIQWAATLLVFFTGSWWWRPHWIRNAQALPDWLQDVEMKLYFIHYGFFPLVVMAILAWGLSGFPGIGRLATGFNLFWIMLVIQLPLWALVTIPPEVINRTVAFSAALQALFAAIFALTILANAPPPRLIAGALMMGLLFQSLLGIAQVAIQDDLNIHKIDIWLSEQVGRLPFSDQPQHGLIDLWEPNLDLERSGVSVVQAEGVRYLRPYGVSAHPNMLAGMLAMGLCAVLGLWWSEKLRRWMTIPLIIGLWALLLTFSRSAWGGFAVGSIVIAGLAGILRLRDLAGTNPRVFPFFTLHRKDEIQPDYERKDRHTSLSLQSAAFGDSILGFGILVSLVAFTFGILYAPLVGVRAGIGSEGTAQSVEALSVEARAVYREQANFLIKEHPWRGVGIGNFNWNSARLLANDWRDLNGDYVHNIFLLSMAEVGMVGFTLFMSAILLGSGLIAWRTWRGSVSLAQLGLFGGVVSWLALGWFDHYPWTMFGYLLLFWGSFAGALSQAND